MEYDIPGLEYHIPPAFSIFYVYSILRLEYSWNMSGICIFHSVTARAQNTPITAAGGLGSAPKRAEECPRVRVPLAAAAAVCYCPRIPQVCVAADGIQRIPLTFPGIFQAYSTGVRRRRRNTLYSEYILGVFQAYSTGVRSRCRLYPSVFQVYSLHIPQTCDTAVGRSYIPHHIPGIFWVYSTGGCC